MRIEPAQTGESPGPAVLPGGADRVSQSSRMATHEIAARPARRGRSGSGSCGGRRPPGWSMRLGLSCLSVAGAPGKAGRSRAGRRQRKLLTRRQNENHGGPRRARASRSAGGGSRSASGRWHLNGGWIGADRLSSYRRGICSIAQQGFNTEAAEKKLKPQGFTERIHRMPACPADPSCIANVFFSASLCGLRFFSVCSVLKPCLLCLRLPGPRMFRQRASAPMQTRSS